jgi:cytochrome c
MTRRKRRPLFRRTAATLLACLAAGSARAQIPFPIQTEKPDGATLFRNQCATCHTLSAADGPRQGPTLEHVIGRHAGAVPGFAYSDGFKTADFTWDAAHLDAWLTNPQAVIPGAVMPYHQDDPEIRQTIIAYLQEQH